MKELFLTEYLYGKKEGEYFNGKFCVIYSFIFTLLLFMFVILKVIFEVTGDKMIISFIYILLYSVHAFILIRYDNMAINIISVVSTSLASLFIGYWLIVLIIPIGNFLIFTSSRKEKIIRLTQLIGAGIVVCCQFFLIFMIISIDIPTGYDVNQSIVSPDKTYVIKELITDRGLTDTRICIYKNNAVDLGFINIQSREGSYDIEGSYDMYPSYYNCNSIDNDIEWIDDDTVAVNGKSHDVQIP